MTLVGAAGLEPACLIEALVLQTSADCHYLHRAHTNWRGVDESNARDSTSRPGFRIQLPAQRSGTLHNYINFGGLYGTRTRDLCMDSAARTPLL
jgi:hypothetical protein